MQAPSPFAPAIVAEGRDARDARPDGAGLRPAEQSAAARASGRGAHLQRRSLKPFDFDQSYDPISERNDHAGGMIRDREP